MQKGLSYTEVGFMSQTTLNSIMTWCMCTTEPLSQVTPEDGRYWNWCHRTTGGQDCPGMSPSSLLDAMHATKPRPSPMQKVGKLVPNKIPDQHWQVISVDMIRELLDLKGYNAVVGRIIVWDKVHLWSLVLWARAYCHDCIILAFHSTYETQQRY